LAAKNTARKAAPDCAEPMLPPGQAWHRHGVGAMHPAVLRAPGPGMRTALAIGLAQAQSAALLRF
jgi:hypothetical protein